MAEERREDCSYGVANRTMIKGLAERMDRNDKTMNGMSEKLDRIEGKLVALLTGIILALVGIVVNIVANR